MLMVPSAVIPLHCTTVLSSLDVALNVKVEAISASSVLIAVVELEVLVRVATKCIKDCTLHSCNIIAVHTTPSSIETGQYHFQR